MTNSRSQYDVSITTSPSDFGYGNKPAPSDSELIARIGVDKRGTVRTVSDYLQSEYRKLGSTQFRFVIRACASGKFISRDEFGELVAEMQYTRS